MATSPKEVEDSEDEEMSDEEDESSGEEVIIPQKKGKKATTTPGKKVMVFPTQKMAVATPGKRAVAVQTPGKKAAVTPAKALASPRKKGGTPAEGAKNSKNAKQEGSDEEDDSSGEEEEEGEEEGAFEPAVTKAATAAPFSDDEDEDEEDDSEEPMEIAPAKGKKAPVKAVPVKAKSTAEEEDKEEEEEEEEDLDKDDNEEDEEMEEEEEYIKKTPDKRKKEMAKEKAFAETKKQKLEAEPPVAFKLFVGNLNFNKTAAELKTGLREFFAKNELTVVGVRVGSSRRFGYVNFKSADDQEKALELSETEVLGYEITLKKPKGKETKKDRNAKTLLIKNLPGKVTEQELKEEFEDAFQIRLLSKDGMSERIAYIDFKSQADAERALEEKQGTEIGGLAIVLEHVGEKNPGREDRARKNRGWGVRKRKTEQGSHTFQEKWERAYFFAEVKNVPTCLICKESLSVWKEYSLRCHYETNHSKDLVGYTGKMRDKKLNELKKRLKLQHDLLLNVNEITDAALKCSYVLSEKMARASKPLADGAFIKECLLRAAEILCPEQKQAFADINLTGDAVPQHADSVAESFQDRLQEKAKSFVAFSIAAHESTYMNNAPQLAVFIRGVDETFDVTEELLDVVPLTGTTSGNDLFLCIEKSLNFHVDWSKLVSVSTGGTSAAVSVKQLVTKLKSKLAGLCKDTELKTVHGLFLQESLCAKTLQLNHVMDTVIYTIAWLRPHGATHRKFSAFFSALDSQHGHLPSTGWKWPSPGLVLRQFFELLEEIDFFMSSKGKPVPQLRSKDWVKDLAFLVDVTTYVNTLLEGALPGRSQAVTQMYGAARSFLAKLCLWETHLARSNLAHFPTLRSVSENDSDGLSYIPKIQELKAELQKRFSDFQRYENELILFSSPFSININNVNEELQMEVIELQYNTILKTKYDNVGIPEFFQYLGNSYPKYKNHCAKMLSMFGSTYVCEQLFSVMKQ